MTSPKTIDYILLSILTLIWASAFFNIKIATYSYGPLTIAFLRMFLGAVLIVIMSVFKNIKIDGITQEIMQVALEQARDGRINILNKMYFKRNEYIK